MIITTQGHEKGIGLEIFLKAFLCLPTQLQSRHLLICFEKTLQQHLGFLNITSNIVNSILNISGAKLNLILLEEEYPSQTSACLKKALEIATKSDIINTLPSSKDQIKSKKQQYKGHTDYLAEYFQQAPIMTFFSPNSNVMLLTDHIPIDQVYKHLIQQNLSRQIQEALQTFPNNRPIERILFAGINPHCGEGGVISNQDELIWEVSKRFQNKYQISVLSGDTVQFSASSKKDLIVYPSHDQGLSSFKTKNGLFGINFTAGLPIKRVSVDHGTAFNLFGKNRAGYQSMSYLLNEMAYW